MQIQFLKLNKNTDRIDRVSTNTNAFRTVFFFFDFRSFLSNFSVMKIALISVPIALISVPSI